MAIRRGINSSPITINSSYRRGFTVFNQLLAMIVQTPIGRVKKGFHTGLSEDHPPGTAKWNYRQNAGASGLGSAARARPSPQKVITG